MNVSEYAKENDMSIDDVKEKFNLKHHLSKVPEKTAEPEAEPVAGSPEAQAEEKRKEG